MPCIVPSSLPKDHPCKNVISDLGPLLIVDTCRNESGTWQEESSRRQYQELREAEHEGDRYTGSHRNTTQMKDFAVATSLDCHMFCKADPEVRIAQQVSEFERSQDGDSEVSGPMRRPRAHTMEAHRLRLIDVLLCSRLSLRHLMQALAV